MATLSPEKQAQLDALLAEQNAPDEPAKPVNPFEDIYDVVAFLVHHSTAFSGNEDLRTFAQDVINVAAGRGEKDEDDSDESK